MIEEARRGGGTITREPSETFYGGYAGVFRDLDGHAWEIAHNPGFGLKEDGSIMGRLTSARDCPNDTEQGLDIVALV